MKRCQGFSIVPIAVLLLVVSILAALGTWQLSRMYEKQDYLADIKAKQASSVPLETALQNDSEPLNQPVSIRGAFENDHLWLLDNQLHNRSSGYNVYRIASGNYGNVLVDLGWIKAPLSRDQFPQVPEGGISINAKGVVVKPSSNPFIQRLEPELREVNDYRLYRVQEIDIQSISEVSGIYLQPFIVKVIEPSPNFVRQWKPVNMPPEKHLGYAIQWFGLAIGALVIGSIVLFRKEKQSESKG